MTGSSYKAMNGFEEIELRRYPDSGSNPATALLVFTNLWSQKHEPEYGEHEVGFPGKVLKELLKQLKEDDPRLYKYLLPQKVTNNQEKE